MSNDCNHKNPLQRSGVNQYERVLQALLPGHVKVDERDYADLILFAKNYATQLQYYNALNVPDGDWHALMSMDVSVTLASLAKLNVEGCFAYVKGIFQTIQATGVADIANLTKHFKTLFDFGFSITHQLNDYYRQLPSTFAFKAKLGSVIQSNLQDYYSRLNSYFTEAKNLNLIDPDSAYIPEYTPVDISLSQDLKPSALDTIWNGASFTPPFNGATVALKIKNTSTHNLFTGIFDQYLKTLARISELASQALDQTLTDFPEHTPHYGLFLTFIRLFRYAQDHLNTFTARHLDLYYKEILKLKNKDAEADHVHLTFELAKGVPNHLLKKDTVFKAGKDKDGVELYYALTEDVVLNRGAVKSLKSIFVNRDATTNTRQVFASPVSNSDDGQGGKLTSADKSWKTFGDTSRPEADIGFVVASSCLYLTEGTRTITFLFYAPAGDPITFTTSDIANAFALQLSGKKGWVDVAINSANVAVHSSKEYFSIKVTSIPIFSTAKFHSSSLAFAWFIVKRATGSVVFKLC